MRKKDLTGQRFGKLVAIESESMNIKGRKRVVWKCQCDCGNTAYIVSDRLIGNIAKSCGCMTGQNISKGKKKQNEYKICGDATVLYTHNGEEIFIDTEDLERLLKVCWSVQESNGYVRGKDVSTGKVVMIHRYIMGLEKNDGMVDHINRNKRDNRKANLRMCTYSQNAINKNTPSNNTSGVCGVSYIKERKLWMARIIKDGIIHDLGCYSKFEDAVSARKTGEKELFGEFAPQ